MMNCRVATTASPLCWAPPKRQNSHPCLSTIRIQCSSSSSEVPLTTEKLENNASVTGGAYDFERATTSLTQKFMPSPKKVTLVRHGLSSWNEERRVQGSSDLSILTETGAQQAEKCRKALANIYFDQCFSSPISRAKSTAEILWQGKEEPLVFLDSLKEAHLFFLEGMSNGAYPFVFFSTIDINLNFELICSILVNAQLTLLNNICTATILNHAHSVCTANVLNHAHNICTADVLNHAQYLEPVDARQIYPKEYMTWREDPCNFCVNGVYPVRMLWETANEAWKQILFTPGEHFLVVTHKSMLRALICTALGLGPERFRAIDINNGGISVFNFNKQGEAMLRSLNMTAHMYSDHGYVP